MITPNIWGQGQLFALSALDGESLHSDDFIGTLCGDKIGIRFHSKTKRELVITGIADCAPEFQTVSSDVITINTLKGEINIIYADTRLIIGNVVDGADTIALTEGAFKEEIIDDVKIQNTLDGDFTALLIKDNKFAFALEHSAEAAAKKVQKGIETDIATLKEKHLSLYKNFNMSGSKYDRLYAKCISVMKSQLYSPEGRFTRIWSTPDRLPHKYLWLWDSVFHAIGHRHINPTLAEDLILEIFEAQGDDGFIAHMANLELTSDITQPPVIAWGSYLVYEKSGNKEFLKTVFQRVDKFLHWCHRNRRQSDGMLYTWLTTDNDLCRCDECGMDNSPRFDKDTLLEAIDFSCFMANETRFMAKIASVLGDNEQEKYYSEWHEQIKAAVNSKLWSEDDGFYFDYDIKNDEHSKVWSVASFLPLFAGVCDDEKARILLSHLSNPETFCSPFPVPSISKQDPTYGSDMWRGPVWMNYNYMIYTGLKNYGFTDYAKELKTKTLDVVNQWYMNEGTVYEFYDPENIHSPSILNRKGLPYKPYDFNVRYQSIRDYGWTATITMDLLSND